MRPSGERLRQRAGPRIASTRRPAPFQQQVGELQPVTRDGRAALLVHNGDVLALAVDDELKTASLSSSTKVSVSTGLKADASKLAV